MFFASQCSATSVVGFEGQKLHDLMILASRFLEYHDRFLNSVLSVVALEVVVPMVDHFLSVLGVISGPT